MDSFINGKYILICLKNIFIVLVKLIIKIVLYNLKITFMSMLVYKRRLFRTANVIYLCLTEEEIEA